MPLKSGEKSFILITGASRGFGRAIAASFARVLGQDSRFLLLGRDANGLEATKKLILSVNNADEGDSKRFSVGTKSLDLVNANGQDFVELFRDEISPNEFDQLIIIHNAGSTGDVSRTAKELGDPSEVTDYFTVNLSSTLALNSAFLDFAKAIDNDHKIVVHITSLCGVKPMKNMALYCAGKAARDMAFQVLAAEEPSLQVLAWSPGPLEGTDMSTKVRTETGDAATRQMFEQLLATDAYVRCDSSANKMIEILLKNDFQSGAHIDYYD